MLPLLNTRRGARRNIAAHYDLGNELFETFLDTESMMYSSACFEHEDQSLEEAQRNKLERICRGLELSPDDHLLEIGTGWGGLAVYAARRARLPRHHDDDLSRAARLRGEPGARRRASSSE